MDLRLPILVAAVIGGGLGFSFAALLLLKFEGERKGKPAPLSHRLGLATAGYIFLFVLLLFARSYPADRVLLAGSGLLSALVVLLFCMASSRLFRK